MTPNLDALGHHWVVALAGYNMKLEYLKGTDNKVADALSRVSTQKLDEETVAELLNCTWNGGTPRVEMANSHVIEEGELVDQEVIVWYTQIVKQHNQFWNLANLDWVKAQNKDPVIPQVVRWFKFTLKPPYSITHGKLRLAIWDTFGLFWSNLDTRDLETYPRTYSGHF